MKYRRVLLKLSGESLMGSKDYGIDPDRLSDFANEIKSVTTENIEVAIVIGGGNIFRGIQGISEGIERVQGDYMGMLATVINSMALQSALEKIDVKTELLSGITIEQICKPMSSRKAIKNLENGKVVIICGGTGNPYFTTDTASALRAVEIKAEVILKGTRVDGIYNADPEKESNAIKFDKLTFDEALKKELKIMDLTAFALCKENKLPILVFNMNTSGNLKKVVSGENIGTLVSN